VNNSYKKKIFLGTAQLINAYGAVKLKSTKNKKEIFRFLDYALENGINKFDTAQSYKSEDVIGEFINSNKKSNIKITTKIPSLPKRGTIDRIEFIKKSLNTSLKKLKTNIYTLFLHNENDAPFFFKNISKIQKIKKEFGVKYLGLSLYTLKNLDQINRINETCAIQFPFNFSNDEILKKKINGKHIIFARSIFLQGILLNKKIKKKIPEKVRILHQKYFKEIKKKQINPLNLCINYAFNQNKIKYIVLGCDNVNQLKEILNASMDVKIKDYNYYKNLFNMPETKMINY
tara:strand:+ start:774 stop:1637 length:864 start_codon:yes stop_codon:yes gene_type:complete